MVDTGDSKSPALKSVPVRVRPLVPPPFQSPCFTYISRGFLSNKYLFPVIIPVIELVFNQTFTVCLDFIIINSNTEILGITLSPKKMTNYSLTDAEMDSIISDIELNQEQTEAIKASIEGYILEVMDEPLGLS